MAIISIEESNKVRKEKAKSTGEASLARVFSEIFIKHKVSMAQHRYEFEGVKGVIDITFKDKQIKSNAIFWYENKTPRITLSMRGELKVVSLIGKKTSEGKFVKFSVLKSKLNAGCDAGIWMQTGNKG